MTERTLVLIKPDAMARGLAGEILARYERKSLSIVEMPGAVALGLSSANRPARTGSIDAPPPGDVGDDGPPPQAANIVASVAPEAT